MRYVYDNYTMGMGFHMAYVALNNIIHRSHASAFNQYEMDNFRAKRISGCNSSSSRLNKRLNFKH